MKKVINMKTITNKEELMNIVKELVSSEEWSSNEQ